MEHKKTFGSFILQCRKELGMTQKDFAARLFVTESAVSKWERGLSYPDITLIQNICEVLDVSEHELLSGSEDTRQRNSDRLAERYIRLCRRTRLTQFILYGTALLSCAIVNLATAHRLDWFFIVLFSVLLCASILLVPSLCALDSKWERWRPLLSFGGFTASLLLLLLSICLYTGGSWFFVSAAACLFAISLLVLPFLLPWLPLPEKYSRCRLSLYLAAGTLMLLLLLLVCCIQTGGDWFAVAVISVLFGLGFLFTPVFLRQLPLPAGLQSCKTSLYLAIQTGLLLLLLLVSCLYTGGRWFPLAAVACLFGLGLVFLPLVFHQVKLPGKWGRNRLLLYFCLESLLLFLVVWLANAASVTGFDLRGFTADTLLTLLMLALPWGLMLFLRYLPASRYFRAAVACGWGSLWLWTFPLLLDAILAPFSGGQEVTSDCTLATPFLSADLGFGLTWFWDALLILALAAAALVLAFLGLRQAGQQKEAAD